MSVKDLEEAVNIIIREIGDIIKGRVGKRLHTDCALLIAEADNDSLVISVTEGSYGAKYIVKVSTISKLGNVPLSCDELEYSPHGLYLIALNLNDLRNIKKKVVKIMKS